MNKRNILLGIFIFVFVSMVFIVVFNSNNTTDGSLIEVNYEDIINKTENSENFILVISQSTCSHCATYRPKLKEIAHDYNIDIYYIDYDKEDEDIQDKFLEEFDLSGATPTTIFINDGKEVSLLNRLEGDLSKSKVVEKFKKMGFIEK